MKKIMYLAILAIVLVACKKEEYQEKHDPLIAKLSTVEKRDIYFVGEKFEISVDANHEVSKYELIPSDKLNFRFVTTGKAKADTFCLVALRKGNYTVIIQADNPYYRELGVMTTDTLKVQVMGEEVIPWETFAMGKEKFSVRIEVNKLVPVLR